MVFGSLLRYYRVDPMPRLNLSVIGRTQSVEGKATIFQMENEGLPPLLVYRNCSQQWADTNGPFNFRIFKYTTNDIQLRSGEVRRITIADPPDSIGWSAVIDFKEEVSILVRAYRALRAKLPFDWMPPDDKAYSVRSPYVSDATAKPPIGAR